MKHPRNTAVPAIETKLERVVPPCCSLHYSFAAKAHPQPVGEPRYIPSLDPEGFQAQASQKSTQQASLHANHPELLGKLGYRVEDMPGDYILEGAAPGTLTPCSAPTKEITSTLLPAWDFGSSIQDCDSQPRCQGISRSFYRGSHIRGVTVCGHLCTICKY